MLHKLKPVPRFLLIAVVLAAVGYGVSQYDFKKPAPENANAVPAPTVTTVTPPAPNTAPPAPVAEAPAPAAPAPAPADNNVTSGSRGLDAVLGAGKK